jgi:predicted nucleic acid-binding protein
LIIYVDTSAVLNLVVEEKESSSAAEYPTKAASKGHQLAASMLLWPPPSVCRPTS